MFDEIESVYKKYRFLKSLDIYCFFAFPVILLISVISFIITKDILLTLLIELICLIVGTVLYIIMAGVYIWQKYRKEKIELKDKLKLFLEDNYHMREEKILEVLKNGG